MFGKKPHIVVEPGQPGGVQADRQFRVFAHRSRPKMEKDKMHNYKNGEEEF
jgi:hypothetical protein